MNSNLCLDDSSDWTNILSDDQHKETQTNSLSDASSHGLPEPPHECETNKDLRALKIFEFCQILTDPESPLPITLIKDSFSEESLVLSEETGATSNRYIYRRETIKPYVKTSLKECQNPEQGIADAIAAAQKDFPDYQPCNEVFATSSDIDERNTPSNKSSVSKMDEKTPCKSNNSSILFITPHKALDPGENSSCEPRSTESPTLSKSVLEFISKAVPQCPLKQKDKSHCCPASKPCPKVVVKRKCCKSKEKPKKKECRNANKNCVCNPNEQAIAMRYDGGPKPHYYLTDKCRLCRPCPSPCPVTEKPQPPKSLTKATGDTVAAIKKAVEGMFCKIYKTTREAVTLVSQESAKHLGRDDPIKSESCDADVERSYRQFRDERSTETVKTFCGENNSRCNCPKQCSYTMFPGPSQPNNNMFGMVKSKIYSLFSHVGHPSNLEATLSERMSADTASITTRFSVGTLLSRSSSDTDSDDDLMHRLID